MKLTISTLLASIALLSPQALALGGDNALDLQYAARDAEALYGVATANGDLRFINQGPSATMLRWFDPLRGEEEVRVLHPGQALLSHGHFGVPISEGTVVLVEKVGPGPLTSGIASIPTSPQFRGCIPTDPCTLVSQQGEPNQMHDSVHCLHNNGAFLPWHRGYFAPVDTLVGGTMCSIESYRGILGVLSSSATEHNSLLGDGSVRFVLGDGTVRFLLGDGSVRFLGGQEGEALHDSVHCYSSGTGHTYLWDFGDGSTSTVNELIAIIAIAPGETQMTQSQCQGACYADSQGVIWGQTIAKSLEHGPGMHDSIHDWQPCPPYEPCDDVLVLSIWTAGSTTSIWTSGTASIWTDGTFSSIAPDGTVDL